MKSYIKYSVSDIDETQLVIDMVYVAPEERRQGKAKELVKSAIKYARDNNFESVGLWAEPQEKDGISKADLISFYEKMGFDRGCDADEDMTYTI